MLSLVQKGSQEVVLQGHPSSTAQMPHLQRVPNLTFILSALLCMVRNVPFSLIYLLPVYSLCLSSTSISQLLQLSVLQEFILFVNL